MKAPSFPWAARGPCEKRVRLTPGAETLGRTMAAHGARCVLVSGGFDFFTERVAVAAGFHAHRANRLIDDGSRLTGDVARPILGREAKRERNGSPNREPNWEPRRR